MHICETIYLMVKQQSLKLSRLLENYTDCLRKIVEKQSADNQKLLFHVYHYSKGVGTEPNFALVFLDKLWQKGLK